MLGKQHSGLDSGEHTYLDHVGRDSFYGFLALHRGELFQDEDFTDLYCSDNGRPSVPPSLLAMALLLQVHDGVSDEEAKARADFDLRWKVALGIGLEERPFAKSTLQLFRAHLIVHERVRTVFQRRVWTSRAGQATSGVASSRSFWTPPTYWVGGRLRTPTTCWAMGSRSSLGRWLPLSITNPRSSQMSAASTAILAPASRGKRASTGTTRRRGECSWEASSPTPTSCWR